VNARYAAQAVKDAVETALALAALEAEILKDEKDN